MFLLLLVYSIWNIILACLVYGHEKYTKYSRFYKLESAVISLTGQIYLAIICVRINIHLIEMLPVIIILALVLNDLMEDKPQYDTSKAFDTDYVGGGYSVAKPTPSRPRPPHIPKVHRPNVDRTRLSFSGLTKDQARHLIDNLEYRVKETERELYEERGRKSSYLSRYDSASSDQSRRDLERWIDQADDNIAQLVLDLSAHRNNWNNAINDYNHSFN